MSTTNGKNFLKRQYTNNFGLLFRGRLFSGMKTCLGAVDWVFGAVGGKVLLGDTGDTSMWGIKGTDKGDIRVNAHLVSVQNYENH